MAIKFFTSRHGDKKFHSQLEGLQDINQIRRHAIRLAWDEGSCLVLDDLNRPLMHVSRKQKRNKRRRW